MKLYLSSTLRDLVAEREVVKKVVEGECTIVESYTASEFALVDSCLADVERCDLFVGIVGLRFGFVPPGHEKSITQLEYERAGARGVRRFMFVKNVDAIVPEDTDDYTGEHPVERVLGFRLQVAGGNKDGNRPAVFDNASDLAVAVSKSIGRYVHTAGKESTIPEAQADAFDAYLRAVDDYCAISSHAVVSSANSSSYVEPAVRQDADERELNPLPGGDVRATITQVVRSMERSGLRSWSLLVKGEPGSGKTTVLRHLATRSWHAPESIGLSLRRLPIVIRLRWFVAQKGSYSERCRAALLEDNFPFADQIPADFFEAWPKRFDSRWLVLLDGIDEVPEQHHAGLDDDVRRFRRFCERHGHVLVISTRPLVSSVTSAVYRDLAREIPGVRVLPFDTQQQQLFLSQYLGPMASSFAAEFRRANFGDLAGSPLFLTMSASLYKDPATRRIPSSAAQLYEQYLQQWAQEALRRRGAPVSSDLNELMDGISELAIGMTDRPELEEWRAVEQLISFLGSPAKAQEALDVFGRVSGVLTTRGTSIEWQHRSFREYLAARLLSKTVRPADPRAWRLVSRWSEDTWRQVIIFLCQLWRGREDVGKLLSRLSQQDVRALELALEAIVGGAQATESVESTLIRRVTGKVRSLNMNSSCGMLLFLPAPPTRLLGKVKGRPEVVQELTRLATHPMHFDILVRDALDALVDLGHVDGLVAHLNDRNFSPRRQARFCLAIAATGRATRVRERLCDLTMNEELDRDLRVSCARAIRELGYDTIARNVLIALAKHHGERTAIEALAEQHDADALVDLVAHAAGFEKEGAFALVDALTRSGIGALGSLKAIAIDARQRPEVRAEASRAVGQLGDSGDVLEILGCDAAAASIAVLKAAGLKTNDNAVQQRLVDLCGNASLDPGLSIAAAVALKDARLRCDTLLRVADGSAPTSVRIAAALGLASDRPRDAEDLLDKIAVTPEVRDVVAAVAALVEIGATDRALQHLRSLQGVILEGASYDSGYWVDDVARLLHRAGDSRGAAEFLRVMCVRSRFSSDSKLVDLLVSMDETETLATLIRHADLGGSPFAVAARFLIRRGFVENVVAVAFDRTHSAARREEALVALQSTAKDPTLAEQVKSVVLDQAEDGSLRQAAIETLVALSDVGAASTLGSLLVEEQHPLDLRLRIAETLASIDVEEPALPWLRELALSQHATDPLRLRACQALLRAGWSDRATAPLRMLARPAAGGGDDETAVTAAARYTPSEKRRMPSRACLRSREVTGNPCRFAVVPLRRWWKSVSSMDAAICCGTLPVTSRTRSRCASFAECGWAVGERRPKSERSAWLPNLLRHWTSDCLRFAFSHCCTIPSTLRSSIFVLSPTIPRTPKRSGLPQPVAISTPTKTPVRTNLQRYSWRLVRDRPM